jgi:hypothetical protein
MKIYVWNCPKTLSNYGSGLIVIAASNVEEAWEKMKALPKTFAWQDGNEVYLYMTTGSRNFDPQEDQIEEGFPLQPKEYAIDDLPVLYRWGSE